MRDLLLAIDAGTTSVRAVAFDREGRIRASAQHPLTTRHPQPGWVEQDAAQIRDLSLRAAGAVVAKVGAGRVEAIGITNQRETAIAWDRETGEPLGPAIVWQDRRTADVCLALAHDGYEESVRKRTGLRLDPYFSATKFGWLIRNLAPVAKAAEAGRLALGTVDSWLLFALSDGQVHATDPTNASRTLLMDLACDAWDADLLGLFGVPQAALPRILPSVGEVVRTRAFGPPIPVAAVAGDQQAALAGQGCAAPGEAKCTYGTGIFLLAHSGGSIPRSRHRLLSTRVAGDRQWALEGSVFVGGDAVKWLRDRLGLIATAAETAALAASVESAGGVVVVPAFVGLGAPWWQPNARGLVTGITPATGRAELVRATLEAMGNQTMDLIEAFRSDGVTPSALHVDGGMVANDWLCQDLADATGLAIVRPAEVETTALGAAMLAGVGVGWFAGIPEAAAAMTRVDRRFMPRTSETERQGRRAAWRKAIAQVLAGVTGEGPSH
ncbi:MAG: glycerol kinase GlpK [Sphingomonadaceae bacterium]|uniref:FGGY family carbohydrate kinase n=1 Tax=Thermaurantiacus sp. TaxID=2820283 RepID=UPI00298F3174|nr:glycerol kinase GlpK [Thermaurantiacus sp.]MCS6987716.1 glycerol kinase GlpK [Sphingomonadaceae bacterium]MDW8415064.1 glycerol kinase GlpK [Thermaurantiacus sp.]